MADLTEHELWLMMHWLETTPEVVAQKKDSECWSLYLKVWCELDDRA